MRLFDGEIHGLVNEPARHRFRSKRPAAVAGLVCVLAIAWHSTHHGPLSGIWKSEAEFEDEADYVELLQTGSVVTSPQLDMNAVATSIGLTGKVELVCCKEKGMEQKCPALWGQGGTYDFHLALSPDGNKLSGEYLGPKFDDSKCIESGLEWSPWVLIRVQ